MPREILEARGLRFQRYSTGAERDASPPVKSSATERFQIRGQDMDGVLIVNLLRFCFKPSCCGRTFRSLVDADFSKSGLPR